MKQVVYLTFNDSPSGIFASQVIDVCRHWRKAMNVNVRLVSFISLRNFFRVKEEIRKLDADAIVLPMFPGVSNWKMNRIVLGWVLSRLNPGTVVCRGAFACALALYHRNKRRICFDARGAYTAELREYNVVPKKSVQDAIYDLEKYVIANSDFRLAVSEALVRYWREEFGYTGTQHVVVPCTLNSDTIKPVSEAARIALRKTYGYIETDIVVVYSGSAAGWQSLKLLEEVMAPVMRAQPEVHLLLLTKSVPDSLVLLREFPARVQRRWVGLDEVNNVLAACDYGWLVREQSVTNRVASPVKYAEYLAAGLQVIISPDIGDFTEMTTAHQVGKCYSSDSPFAFTVVSSSDRERSRDVAAKFLSKPVFLQQYRQLLG